MDFDTARAAKFEKGRREHGADTPWDAAHIDARREMQDECLDLFNYASLLDDEALRDRIQLWCRDIWQDLEDMGGLGPKRPPDARQAPMWGLYRLEAFPLILAGYTAFHGLSRIVSGRVKAPNTASQHDADP